MFAAGRSADDDRSDDDRRSRINNYSSYRSRTGGSSSSFNPRDRSRFEGTSKSRFDDADIPTNWGGRERRAHDHDRRWPEKRRRSNRYDNDTHNLNTLRQEREREERQQREEREKQLRLEREREEQLSKSRLRAFGDESSDSDHGGIEILGCGSDSDDDSPHPCKKPKKERSSSSSSSESSADKSRSKKFRSKKQAAPSFKLLSRFDSIQTPPVFEYLTTSKENVKPPDYKYSCGSTKSLNPVYITDSKLRLERVENIYAKYSLDCMVDGRLQIITVPLDLVNLNGPSVTHSYTEPIIDYDDISNYKAMKTLEQTVNAQSNPPKREAYIKRQINVSNDMEEKVKLYIELVNIQEEVIDYMRSQGELTGTVDIKGKKLSIIETSLKELSAHCDLHLLHIEVLTEIHGPRHEEVVQAWKKIINRFPNNLKMWRTRINNLKRDRAYFHYATFMRDVVKPCLERLGGILCGSFQSHPPQAGTEEFIKEVILMVTSLSIESGHIHHAISILQAYVEFYFFAPKCAEFSKLLSGFKNYWGSSVLKAGYNNAKGWCAANFKGAMIQYDLPANAQMMLGANEEQKLLFAEFRNFVGSIEPRLQQKFENNERLTRNDIDIPRHRMFAAAEKWRTEHFWKPTINDFTGSPELSYLHRYTSFDRLKCFLIKFSNDSTTPLNIVRHILAQFGAKFPNLTTYSYEWICDVFDMYMETEELHFNYVGMDNFLDNILDQLSIALPDQFLQLFAARLMTRAHFLYEKNADITTFWRDFVAFSKKISEEFCKQRRALDVHERHVITSFMFELHLKYLHKSKKQSEFGGTLSISEVAVPCRSLNIFEENCSPSLLLASLRLFTFALRGLPFRFDIVGNDNSKLIFLLKMVLNSWDSEFSSYISPNVISTAKDQFAMHFDAIVKRSNEMPAESYWIGCIADYIRELYAIFLFEAEPDPLNKFNVFSKLFDKNELHRNEQLAETYFGVWEAYLAHYSFCITDFMLELRVFINIFPRNAILLKLYLQHVPQDEIHSLFIGQKRHEDETIRTIRSIAEVSFEIRHQNLDLRFMQTRYSLAIDVLRNVATVCSNTMIAESLLWRILIYYLDCYEQKHVIYNVFTTQANQQCPWSKYLMISASAACQKPKFVEEVFSLCDDAGLRKLVSGTELECFFAKS